MGLPDLQRLHVELVQLFQEEFANLAGLPEGFRGAIQPRRWRRGNLLKWQVHPEQAAMAGVTLHAHLSAHQINQVAHQGQTETRSPEFAGAGIVPLLKQFKDPALIF